MDRVSRIEKQSSEHKALHVSDPLIKFMSSPYKIKIFCADCDACYIGETNGHLAIRVREHLTADRNSQIFQHTDTVFIYSRSYLVIIYSF